MLTKLTLGDLTKLNILEVGWMNKKHITIKCKIAMANLFKILNIHEFLTKESCEILILGLVILHLNYNNALLWGLLDVDMNRFQYVQNISAKTVCLKKKFNSNKDFLHEYMEFFMPLSWPTTLMFL